MNEQSSSSDMNTVVNVARREGGSRVRPFLESLLSDRFGQKEAWALSFYSPFSRFSPTATSMCLW